MEYILAILIIYIVNSFFKKRDSVNNTGQLHQELSEKKKIPLTGGFFLLLFFCYCFYDDLIFLTFFIVIFVVGVLTDLDRIKSPSIRIVIQILFIISFLYYSNLSIDELRVDILDSLLKDKYFNYFFVTFCFLVLINGSNFIDGNNGLSIGYYLIIFLILFIMIDEKIFFLIKI